MKQVLCSGGFIVKGDLYLFGKREPGKDWAPGLWDIVGGKARKRETPFQTLEREILEETGISVHAAEMVRTMEVKDEQGNHLFTYHIFVVTAYTGTPVNCSPEHTSLQWFSRDELKEIALALPEYLDIIDSWKFPPDYF